VDLEPPYDELTTSK